jgi:hypothetical protein
VAEEEDDASTRQGPVVEQYFAPAPQQYQILPEIKIGTNKYQCPYCGALDSIVNGICQMIGCGRAVKSDKPRENAQVHDLRPEEVIAIAAAKARKLGIQLAPEFDAKPLPEPKKKQVVKVNTAAADPFTDF